MRLSLALTILLALKPLGCRAPAGPRSAAQDPAAGEIPLGQYGGFDAYLVYKGDVGVWTVECLPVFEQYGGSEIVALDDKGRCTVLNSYSGKWTPSLALQDGQWLGGLALGDIDPRRPGRELYVGGKRGNLYQVCPHPQGGFDSNVIGYFPGEEIHTIAAGDLDPSRPGDELVVFTSPGGLYVLRPDETITGGFSCLISEKLPGRVRDALVFHDDHHERTRLATVSRDGAARLLHLEGGKPVWTEIFRTTTGLGRIALRPAQSGRAVVLYVTSDDGRIIRLARQEDGTFAPEIVYAGPQGPRGIVAGRFHADPAGEAIAVFGYSKQVQLVSRINDGWRVETIFEDLDKGHWLAVCELDGRNATDEIVLSGYGSRVVMLARPPGHGLRAVAQELGTMNRRSP